MMGIFGNLDGTFRNRFSIGKPADDVYLERSGSDLTLRDLVVTSAQKLVDILSRTRTSQLAGLTEATSAARLDLLMLELASGGALRRITKANLIRLPTDYLDGFGVSRNATNPAYQVDVVAGVGRSDDDTTDFFSSSTLTADITASGANGLDAGSEAANTWYYVWVVYNPTTDTYASLLSTSATSPTLPSGYTKKRRVGVVRNDGASNFRQFTQIARGRSREYLYDEVSEATLEVLTAGAATTFTDVDLSGFVPSTSELAVIRVAHYGDTAFAGACMIRPNGSTLADPSTRQYAGTNSSEDSTSSSRWEQRTDSSQVIEYASVNSGEESYIWAEGFIDNV